MTDQPGSPRRRKILSAYNPEPHGEIELDEKSQDGSHRRHRRPRTRSHSPTRRGSDDCTKETGAHDDDPKDTTQPRRSRLKLKDHKSSRRRRRSRSRSTHRDEDDRSYRRRHRESHDDHSREQTHREDGSGSHRHRRRHRRHHRSPSPPDPFAEPALDPEAAFRESLFDAMADDEGANYWSAVYGQPVHVYSNEKVGPQGELERMTDEEYAAHVRQKMWEKTHAGLLEERARREEARKAKKEDERSRRRMQRDVEESLRRGEERRSRKKWEGRWEEYEATWKESPTALAWPVESGRREDIEYEAVKTFLVQGLRLEEIGEKNFVARLKEERVRWHPDKIQQKAGGQVDEETMKDVTAIFQYIDRLWGEMRSKMDA